MSKKALKKSVEDVVLAWSIEGVCPDYHRCVKKQGPKSMAIISQRTR